MLRALVNALAAQTALFKVNVRKIVLKSDSLKRTSLYAFSATDAGHGACLLGYRALILVHATYIDPAVHLILVTQFNDKARAGLYAGTTGSTLILINNRQASLSIHADGTKLTSPDTVSASKTAIETAGSATVHKGSRSTTPGSVIDTQAWTILAGTVATYHCNLFNSNLNRMTRYGRDLLHNLALTCRTLETIH